MKVIGVAARDEGGFQAFFARPNSPIVEAGKGHGIIPELYGTADTWRGQEILCAVGTTNQFLLYKTLENFGLTLDDVNVVNMDSSAANTAFLTGQGDVAGVSGPIVFADDKKDFVMVSSDAWAKTGIVTSFVAAPDAWKEKQEAITKWLEVVIMTNEWIEEMCIRDSHLHILHFSSTAQLCSINPISFRLASIWASVSVFRFPSLY